MDIYSDYRDSYDELLIRAGYRLHYENPPDGAIQRSRRRDPGPTRSLGWAAGTGARTLMTDNLLFLATTSLTFEYGFVEPGLDRLVQFVTYAGDDLVVVSGDPSPRHKLHTNDAVERVVASSFSRTLSTPIEKGSDDLETITLHAPCMFSLMFVRVLHFLGVWVVRETDPSERLLFPYRRDLGVSISEFPERYGVDIFAVPASHPIYKFMRSQWHSWLRLFPFAYGVMVHRYDPMWPYRMRSPQTQKDMRLSVFHTAPFLGSDLNSFSQPITARGLDL